MDTQITQLIEALIDFHRLGYSTECGCDFHKEHCKDGDMGGCATYDDCLGRHGFLERLKKILEGK